MIAHRPPRTVASPMRDVVTGVRVGLFETSSDVNACVKATQTLIDCIESTVAGTMTHRYPGVTFSGIGMTPKCAAGGTTKAASFSGVTGTVNLCEGPEFDDDNRLYKQWAVFHADFQAFVQAWNDSLGILSADDFRRCQSFAKDANAWLDRWIAADVPIPKCNKVGAAGGVDGESMFDQIITVVKWTAVGVIGIGTLYVVTRVL